MGVVLSGKVCAGEKQRAETGFQLAERPGINGHAGRAHARFTHGGSGHPNLARFLGGEDVDVDGRVRQRTSDAARNDARSGGQFLSR